LLTQVGEHDRVVLGEDGGDLPGALYRLRARSRSAWCRIRGYSQGKHETRHE